MEQGSSGQPFYLNDDDTCTIEQLKTSDLRSLGDNVKLLAVIQNLSNDLVVKSENTYKKLDEVQREAEIKSVGVKNLINEFQMLADSQFIENRISDTDERETTPEEPYENNIGEEPPKPPPDQKILPIIQECISNSLKFIDETFNLGDKLMRQTTESDDEEDYVKETLARAIENNPFNRTPLPAIIGSQAFYTQDIFLEGENSAEDNQNDNKSEISSDRISIISDDDMHFSSNHPPNNVTSINQGIIQPPQPPPLPKLGRLSHEVSSDDDETLFPVDKPSTQPRTLAHLPNLPQLRSLPQQKAPEDRSDDLFFTKKTVTNPAPIQISRDTPPPIPDDEDSNSDDDYFFSSKKINSKPSLGPPKPQIVVKSTEKIMEKKAEKWKSDDDDDDELFAKAKPPLNKPSRVLVLPPLDINNSSDDSDSDDLFKPLKGPSKSSIKTISKTQEPPKSPPEAKDSVSATKPKTQPDNIWSLDSDDDDDDLFKAIKR